jgi:hypothetical protein
MHLDFYMPLSFTARTPSFFIIPQHQPLISIFTWNYYYSVTSLAQRNSSTSSPVVWTRKKKILERTCLLASPFSLLSYLPSSITQTFLQCNRSFHHPSFGIAPILHKTQANKVAYLCIPYNSDGHWRAPKSRGETHLSVSQSQVAKSWDLVACSRLPTLKRGRGSSWEPRD